MTRFVKRNRMTVLALGLALVLAAGGLATASNMGFKFLRLYPATNDLERQTVVLPYFQSQYLNSHDLWLDVQPLQATSVCRYTHQPSQPAVTICWAGAGGGLFPITNDEAFQLNFTDGDGGPGGTQVIVGAHNPSFQFTLEPNGLPGPLCTHADLPSPGACTNVISLPYHMTYVTAHDLFLDIPTAANICKIELDTTVSCWAGAGGGIFNLNVGEAYEIQVDVQQTWTPDHY